MHASLLASFIVFVITGAVTFAYSGLPFASGFAVKSIVFATLLLNACFFFYYEAYTEYDQDVQKRLKSTGRFEWWLRVLAQAELFSLWFFLQCGWSFFSIALVALYLTYLVWDMVTWDAFSNHFLHCLDICGAVLAIAVYFLFHLLSVQVNPTYMMFLGIIMMGFLYIVVLGIVKLRFNPLADF